ncbi:hypothetical protein JXB37_06455, partial [candidate division WOR-3 bacterium]|nr:hypothetical protein [candidate division WOR-3 bacterium]
MLAIIRQRVLTGDTSRYSSQTQTPPVISSEGFRFSVVVTVLAQVKLLHEPPPEAISCLARAMNSS